MTRALTRHDYQRRREVGHSLAVRAQRLGILPKHSFPHPVILALAHLLSDSDTGRFALCQSSGPRPGSELCDHAVRRRQSGHFARHCPGQAWPDRSQSNQRRFPPRGRWSPAIDSLFCAGSQPSAHSWPACRYQHQSTKCSGSGENGQREFPGSNANCCQRPGIHYSF